MTTDTVRPGMLGNHPLEPLSAEEIARAAEIVRSHPSFVPAMRFVSVELLEPPKQVVRGWSPDAALIPRRVFAVLRERGRNGAHEVVVDLNGRSVRSWEYVDGVQPAITEEEWLAAEETVRHSPEWQEAMRRRGVEDFGLVMVDVWAPGHTGPQDAAAARRIARVLTFLRVSPSDNGFARPVDGVVAMLDLDRMEVVELHDHGLVPIPEHAGNYAPGLAVLDGNVPRVEAMRSDLRQVSITQPDGPSFTVDGHEVTWQKWRFRIGFTMREGLVLHDIGYADGDTVRPVLYRASIAEMWVPYGDPSPTQSFKNVFEEGEYGIGWLVNSLTLGCDCLGHIHYFDGVVNDQQGGAVTIPNAVCMHEEDYGIGWKHTDVRTGDAVVRRSRRLAVSSISTFDNYDYGFYWYLYLDGTVEFEVKLTGIISAAATAPGLPLRHGVLVAPGVYGPHHQHYFSVRLDTAIDGDTNTVVEVDTVPSGLAHDPHAWEVARTPLRRESEARRRVDALHSRVWRIENPHRRGPTGTPVAYTLLPGTVAVPPFPEDSPFGRRGRFAFHQLWVTAYHPRERYAAGDYPMQQAEPGGLPSYTEADRNLEATDIVLWYTVGVNHVVRPEDWPVMPVEHAGFRLVPSGFFEGNPALDVPEADGGHC